MSRAEFRHTQCDLQFEMHFKASAHRMMPRCRVLPLLSGQNARKKNCEVEASLCLLFKSYNALNAARFFYIAPLRRRNDGAFSPFIFICCLSRRPEQVGFAILSTDKTVKNAAIACKS